MRAVAARAVSLKAVAVSAAAVRAATGGWRSKPRALEAGAVGGAAEHNVQSSHGMLSCAPFLQESAATAFAGTGTDTAAASTAVTVRHAVARGLGSTW